MSKISDQTLQNYATVLGTERILCYQPNAVDDGYLTPLQIAKQPVAFDTVAGVTYAMVVGDAFRVKLFTSASSVGVTIPTGLTIGTVYEGYQLAAGRLTFTAAGGVTARYPKDANNLDCRITRAQNSPFSFTVIATNDVLFTGDLVSS